MPDNSIAYGLLLECGQQVNLYDWMNTFDSIVRGGPDVNAIDDDNDDDDNSDNDDHIPPEIQYALSTIILLCMQFLLYYFYYICVLFSIQG